MSTPMSMVELVAKALWDCEQDGGETAKYANRVMFGTARKRSWDDAVSIQLGVADQFRARARAAIAAMREPTEAMAMRGCVPLDGAPPGWSYGPTGTPRIWQAMIDAALSEKRD